MLPDRRLDHPAERPAHQGRRADARSAGRQQALPARPDLVDDQRAGSLAIAWTLFYLFRAARARNPERSAPTCGSDARRRRAGGDRRRRLRGHRRDQGPPVRHHRLPDLRRGPPPDQRGRACSSSSSSASWPRCCSPSPSCSSRCRPCQGLLTRFMGYLGMFAGALVLFQITQVPSYRPSGCSRSPTYLRPLAHGLPPAWRSGRSEPWPSSAEMRARRAGEVGHAPSARRQEAPARAAAGGRGRAPRRSASGRGPATPKRKRKRRN